MPAEMYLVTGYPKLLARRMAESFLARGASVAMLVQEHHADEARAWANGRVQIVTGDVASMHLGLSTSEYGELCETVTDIVHAAELSWPGSTRLDLERVNIEGTRAALELATDCRKLRRFTHFSTVFVSGDRLGVIGEDELSAGQAFRNEYEQTKLEAEILVRRAMGQLPCTVLRPGIVIADRKSGRVDRFEGPYTIALLVVTSPLHVPLPLPGDGVAPLNLVPLEYVVSAATALHHDPRAVGRTFHLVDPNPASARRVYELVAQRTGKTVPRMGFGFRLTDALLKLPGLERLTREQRTAMVYVNHLGFFTSRNTLELLDGTAIRCPPVEAYLDDLIDCVRGLEQPKQQA